MELRNDANVYSSIRFSPQIIEPEFGSTKRSRNRVNVVFPEPVDPTIPTVEPASIFTLNPSNNLLRSG